LYLGRLQIQVNIRDTKIDIEWHCRKPARTGKKKKLVALASMTQSNWTMKTCSDLILQKKRSMSNKGDGEYLF